MTTNTDRQTPGAGKVENDHNRQGKQEPTQKNEARRTPQSRHDRDAHIGSGNHSQSRQGTAGGSTGGGDHGGAG